MALLMAVIGAALSYLAYRLLQPKPDHTEYFKYTEVKKVDPPQVKYPDRFRDPLPSEITEHPRGHY
jgi:hypothetical protein